MFIAAILRKMPRYAAVALAFIMLGQAGRSESTIGYRDVAFWQEPGVKVEYSSFLFRSKKADEQIPCPVNRGNDASDALGPCHWQSNVFQHLPQWVWVHFRGPRRIDKVVLHAASVELMPIEFSGQVQDHGAAFHTLFHVQRAQFDPRDLTYTVHFTPVVTNNIRIVIERTAATETPQSWWAELAQVEVFGTDAAADVAANSIGASKGGAAFAALADGAGALQADANTLAAEIARALDDVELDPNELETVTGRLDAIETLKKKYGASISAILVARERFAATLEADVGRDERLTTIERSIAVLDDAIAADAAALRAERRAAVPACETRVVEELHALAMPAARFSVALEPLDEIAAHGNDRIEFRFSANPGEPERALARIASGGERSRVLLALVVALADRRDARTFVFDEIDAGIGGATAVAVGTRLQRLAAVAQVVCVTHLAQIASCAGTHYVLRKHDDGGETTIEVIPLGADDDRLAEIARMLSGDTKRISLEHAATLVASTRGGR